MDEGENIFLTMKLSVFEKAKNVKEITNFARKNSVKQNKDKQLKELPNKKESFY